GYYTLSLHVALPISLRKRIFEPVRAEDSYPCLRTQPLQRVLALNLRQGYSGCIDAVVFGQQFDRSTISASNIADFHTRSKLQALDRKSTRLNSSHVK